MAFPSYPLAFPSQGRASVVMRARSIVAATKSPFTGAEQVQAHPGHEWAAQVHYPPSKRTAAEEVVSFLLKLYGRKGTFLMGDPNGATPGGTASVTPGTPLVAGASQTGNTLAIDGLPTNETGYLLPGDYIQLSTGSTTHLHKVLTQADTDGGGAVTLDIWPELRTSPANNDTVVVSGALGHFRLAQNLTEWSIDEAAFYGISFECVESITVA